MEISKKQLQENYNPTDVDNLFKSNPELEKNVYAILGYNKEIDDKNYEVRKAKYAAQNRIMSDKQSNFANGRGLDETIKELKNINTPESNIVADLIEVERVNIRAKQFNTKTDEGREKSKEQYDIKNRLLDKIFKQYMRNNWDVRYEKSNIPGVSHTLFFIIPDTDIQLSYHGNYENILKYFNSLPSGKWDGIPGATFHKLEEAALNIINENNMDNTDWRQGIDLGQNFIQLPYTYTEEQKKEAKKIYSEYLQTNPDGDLEGFKQYIESKNLQFEGMEISKKELENQKVINQAHTDITRTKGKNHAPNKDEIQKWIDNNPQKVKQITKEDAEDVNFMEEVTKGELEEAKKARTKLRKKSKGDRCTRIAKRKYDVWPSAYASGAVVKCRQGKIWKGLKEDTDKKNEIHFEHEHLDHYSGQDNYELGVYENGEVIGYVDYTIFRNEISVSYILVRPNRRREGFGSMLINKMKKLHPYAKYVESPLEYKTDLGTQFNPKDDINEKWSEKYKRSIDCNNPKGFSQKAHCKGRLKEEEENFGSDDINLSGHKNYTDWVIVHRNLNKPPYFSIKKSNGNQEIGDVIGYDTSILLKDVKFIIKKSGQKAVREKKQKNVHAGTVGKIVSSGGNYDTNGWTLVTYNPYTDDTFIELETGEPIYNAKEAVLKNTREIWVKKEDSLNEKTDFSKEKEQGLHGWFARQGGKGKSKGWVDCNTCRDGKCKSCGRKEGESRSKYPACRPTPSACKTKGRGDSWGKKSANEDVLNEQTKQDIERELKLNEIKSLFQRHMGKL